MQQTPGWKAAQRASLASPGLCAATAMVLLAASSAAQQPHGWSATYTQGGHAVTRNAASAAFVLAEGESVHPEIGAGGLSAIFGAEIPVPQRGRYRFGALVRGGAAQLSVTGAEREALAAVSSEGGAPAFTDWLDLERAEVGLVLSFQRHGADAARLQVLWEMELADGAGFPVEPLPSSAARPWPGFEKGMERGRAALEGRALLELKGCTSCHGAGVKSAEATGLRRGPALERAGERASLDWLSRWIHAPSALRPGSDMPALLGAGEGARAEAEAIARFLASLAEPAERESEAAPAERAELLAREGRVLYHEIGCVACHGALESLADVYGDEYHSDELPAVPVAHAFGALAGKWTRASLAEMLLDPVRTYPDGRMPSLRLSPSEADAIATYLDARWPGGPEPLAPDPEATRRGMDAFVGRGCSACHELPGLSSKPPAAPALDALDPQRGCMDPSNERTPRYELSERERELLAAGIASVREARGDPAPVDRALRAIELANCLHCHAMDGRGGPHEELRRYFTTLREVDLGDEGRIPPELSGAGAKLHTAWIERVLAGEGVARPYMATRMPAYGESATAGLATAFAGLCGVPAHGDLDSPPATDEMVLSGRRLLGLGAMACVSCHVYKDHPPLGTPGTDFTRFAERLRYEWFRSFLADPARYKPGTRMPSFNSGGVSSIRDVYGGDALRQVDAMWAYFSLGEHMPPPPDMPLASALKLEVGDHPRVFRTFLESAGSRGIAVGFPVGIHYAFDAGAVRLVEAWRGDFLDASGTWAGRGGNVAGGRGALMWSALPGPPLLVLGADDAKPDVWPEGAHAADGRRFGGYRILADGAPRFLYSIGTVKLGEHVVPLAEKGVLLRTIEVEELPRGVRLLLRAAPADRVHLMHSGGEWTPPAEERPDASVWYEIEGSGARLEITWQVAL